MYTLNKNYNRNIAILQENLKRGMTMAQANKVIDAQEIQLHNAGLWSVDERDYINNMRRVSINYFTHLTIN
jgi:hypothetical protein